MQQRRQWPIKAFIQDLLNNATLRKYSANTLWLFAERVVSLLVALLITTWIARYLGPERFGMLSFVSATVLLLKPLLSLGLQGIVTRELVRRPEDRQKILATSAGLRIIGSVIYILSAISLLAILEDEPVYMLLAGLLALMEAINLIFEVFQYQFRASVQAKYGVMGQIVGHLAGAASRVTFILVGAGLVWFAVGSLIAAVFTAISLTILFRRQLGAIPLPRNFDLGEAGRLLSESWPVIFSRTFVVIYLYVDQLMLQQMLGPEQVGQYAAAVRISTILFFFPIVINWSIQPAIVQARDRSEDAFRLRISQLTSFLTVAGYVLTGAIVITSGWTVSLLFGDAYTQSAEILRIHAISLLFVFLSQPRGLWVSTDSHFKFAMFSNIAAGILNIALNLALIPAMGPIGAAWATVVSYFVAHIGSGFFYRDARWVAREQVSNLLIFGMFKHLRRAV